MIIKGDKSVICVCQIFSCSPTANIHSHHDKRSLSVTSPSFGMRSGCVRDAFGMRSGYVHPPFVLRSFSVKQSENERRMNRERSKKNYSLSFINAINPTRRHPLVGLYISRSKDLLYQYPSIQLTRI